jgi:peptide/nickel transport system ATP-binding protein
MDSPRDEELVPISGRPPSLITLPGGCSFHPRCPYVREAHRKTEPPLAPVPEDPTHQVACLLDSGTRKRMWRELEGGALPDAVRERALDGARTAGGAPVGAVALSETDDGKGGGPAA